jgi:hypothetical protein
MLVGILKWFNSTSPSFDRSFMYRKITSSSVASVRCCSTLRYSTINHWNTTKQSYLNNCAPKAYKRLSVIWYQPETLTRRNRSFLPCSLSVRKRNCFQSSRDLPPASATPQLSADHNMAQADGIPVSISDNEPNEKIDTDAMYASQGEHICTHTDRASTLLNQRQSPLLRLHAELRNRIYEYALGGSTILINPWFWKPKFRITVCDETSWEHPGCLVALTAVCRRIHAEARFVPFELNCFQSHADYASSVFRLPLMPHQKNQIRNVILMIDCFGYCLRCGLSVKAGLDLDEVRALQALGTLQSLERLEIKFFNVCFSGEDDEWHMTSKIVLFFADEFGKTPRGLEGGTELLWGKGCRH